VSSWGKELLKTYALVLQANRCRYLETNVLTHRHACMIFTETYHRGILFDETRRSSIQATLGYRLYRVIRSRTNVSTNVELAFSERSLRQLCENKIAADRKLGAKIAGRLRRRLADLHAADFVNDLVTGQPREVANDHYTVLVIDDCSITFCPNHGTIPRLASGKVNWSKVSRVKIVKIGATNEHS
jgi:hypothetical protein